MELFLAPLLAYIMGSIPTALWTGKVFHNIDIRELGSGNAGATNTIRVLGLKWGIPVLLFDIAKGFAATQLSTWLPMELPEALIHQRILLGALCVLGHVFPIFAKFKGGKGVASALGVIIGLHLMAALCTLGIFIVIFTISRIVSLSSILAAVSYPIWLIVAFNQNDRIFAIFALIFSGLIIVTHRGNIKRLINGDEKKLSFRSSK